MSACLSAVSTGPSLAGTEGALLTVTVTVQPPRLEELLDALAQLDFPINPQIYHDAELVYRFADEHDETQRTTLVEFPAYDKHLAGIRAVLEACGFPSDSVASKTMLDDIRSEGLFETAPAGSPYRLSSRRKHAVG